jgi:hypothetical protein
LESKTTVIENSTVIDNMNKPFPLREADSIKRKIAMIHLNKIKAIK